MIEEMRAKLAELSAKIERKKKLDAMLQSLQKQEQELTRREQCLKEALAKEEDDVARLERTTATSLLYTMLGKKDAKMDKEQQEAYAAKLKYDAVVRQLDDCKIGIERLSQERDSLLDCAKQYDEVFGQIREQLRANPAYAEQLGALEQQHGMLTSQLKELDEAISAGNAALQQINSIEDHLGSAGNWGTWDLLGGGMLSGLAKHSHLDEAQAGAENLQILLNRFHTELADVYIDAEPGQVQVDGFLRFADYFFDGLFADWAVLSRIDDSKESVCQVKQQVESALNKLSVMRADCVAREAAVAQNIKKLVTFL